MAAKTRIKHLTSSGNSAPTILKTGEIGYSYGAGLIGNGGDRLYIGIQGEDSNGVATEIVNIGGQYYTSLMSAQTAAGVISTAQNPDNSTNGFVPILDSNRKVDQWNVDNIRLDGSTISTQNTNGNLTIEPAGTGKLILNNVYINGADDTLAEFIYDTVGGAVTGTTNSVIVTNSDSGNTSTISLADQITAGSAGSATNVPVITFNSKGQLTAVTTESISTSFTISDGSDTDTFNNGETLTFAGTNDEITTDVTNNTVTIGLPDDVTIADALTVTGNLSVNGSTINLGNQISDTVTVAGNLVVQGTTTTVESTTITLDDPVIALADNTSSNSSDGLDRGVRFKWGTGSAVAEGFFGFDIQTERFVFTKDEDFSVEENASSPWHDAQFGGVYADNVRIGVTAANEIDTSNGNLILDSANGTVEVTDNLSVTGTVTLSNDLAVAHGGTGVSSFTAKGVFISNTGGTALSFVTGSEGDVLQFNSSGVPVSSDIIDGGTY